MSESSVADLREQIGLLRQLDSQLELFGASEHRYEMNPCASEREVRAFEQSHGFVLPDDYRSFVRYVANGGAGPCYGLNTLDQSAAASPVGPGFIHAPFQYSSAVPYVDSEAEDANYDADYDNQTSGTLLLCHEGCGYTDLLVVLGEEQGAVWLDARVSDGGLVPRADSFSAWYGQWLTTGIADLRTRQQTLAVMAEHTVQCRIENVVGRGRARGLTVSIPGIREIRRLHYYVADEFVEEGQRPRCPASRQTVTAVITLQDPVFCDPAQTCPTTGLHQPDRKPPEDAMKNSAESLVSGTVVQVLDDPITLRRHYYACAVADPSVMVFVESSTPLSLEVGQPVHVAGQLSARIL